MITPELIRGLPKVSLHDHLDGGLRPQTVIDLAPEGHVLPANSAEELGRWFFESADSGTLVRYLETFDQTIAVMQTADNLARVAREFVEDMVADGVVYAEARWAPEQHLAGGLSLTEAIEAVQSGLDAAMAEARAAGKVITARQLITGMRQTRTSPAIAALALDYRDRGVAGFDIAGPEDGFPPSLHSEAFAALRHGNACYTIHAGEAYGLPSIQEAVELGAHRLGHGVRIAEDLSRDENGEWQLGRLAAFVRNHRIPLEICPHSNLQTSAAGSSTLAEHPVDLLHRLGFCVTVNCDNRLMSDTTLTKEFTALVDTFGWTLDDIEEVTVAAAQAAFWGYEERNRLVDEVIRPGFAVARRSLT